MDFELTASMMCANFGNLEHEVRELEAGGSGWHRFISYRYNGWSICAELCYVIK